MRVRRPWALALLLVTLAAMGVALTSACMIGAEGCLTGTDGERCGDESRCKSERTIEKCMSSCGGSWYTERCPRAAPYCVTTSVVDAECAAQPHCAATTACAKSGQCADSAEGCLVTANGCAASEGCREEGRCGASGHFCVATAEGCAAARTSCGRDGLCGFGNGMCQATDEGCAAAPACALSGRCAASISRWSCVPTAQGCANSELCRQTGSCRLSDAGECVADNPASSAPSGQ
jgi:hypothetical protein